LEELLEIPTDQLPAKNFNVLNMQKDIRKVLKSKDFRTFLGAAGQIRTADLILTNGMQSPFYRPEVLKTV